MNREDIAKLIEGSALPEEKKLELLNMMLNKDLTPEVVDTIKEAFDNEILSTLKEGGVDIAETEEFKAAEKEFAGVAEAASKELEDGLSQINDDIKQVQQKASKELEDVQAEVIKASVAE